MSQVVSGDQTAAIEEAAEVAEEQRIINANVEKLKAGISELIKDNQTLQDAVHDLIDSILATAPNDGFDLPHSNEIKLGSSVCIGVLETLKIILKGMLVIVPATYKFGSRIVFMCKKSKRALRKRKGGGGGNGPTSKITDPTTSQSLPPSSPPAAKSTAEIIPHEQIL